MREGGERYRWETGGTPREIELAREWGGGGWGRGYDQERREPGEESSKRGIGEWEKRLQETQVGQRPALDCYPDRKMGIEGKGK